MHEQLGGIPIDGSLTLGSDSKELPKEPLPKGYFSSAVRSALALLALIICPGDDILAVTTAVTLGFSSSDTPQAAVLPKPIEIIFKEEDENGNKNSKNKV